jgi:hypothetical protein
MKAILFICLVHLITNLNLKIHGKLFNQGMVKSLFELVIPKYFTINNPVNAQLTDILSTCASEYYTTDNTNNALYQFWSYCTAVVARTSKDIDVNYFSQLKINLNGRTYTSGQSSLQCNTLLTPNTSPDLEGIYTMIKDYVNRSNNGGASIAPAVPLDIANKVIISGMVSHHRDDSTDMFRQINLASQVQQAQPLVPAYAPTK